MKILSCQKLSKRRIGMVTYPGRSGLSHYTYSLCRALGQKVNSLIYFTNSDSEFDCKYLNCKTVKAFSKTRYLPLRYFQFISLVLKYKIRIIHFQSWIKYPIVDFVLFHIFKCFGMKIVFTAHDVIPIQSRLINYRWFMKYFYKIVDAIIVHSETSKKILEEIRIASQKIHVIPCGVFDIFYPSVPIDVSGIKAKLDIRQNYKIILFFGSINERKGTINLLKNIPKFLNKNSAIMFIFAGKSSFKKNYLENMTSELEIDDNVRYLAHWLSVAEVAEVLSISDYVILPYNESYTSGVLKLAYAFHKPIIALRIGEIPEIIEREKTGIVVDSLEDMIEVEKIIEFISDEDNLAIMKMNIKKAIEEKYTWEKIAQETIAVYSDICNEQ